LWDRGSWLRRDFTCTPWWGSNNGRKKQKRLVVLERQKRVETTM
jgi:hypothetical protein